MDTTLENNKLIAEFMGVRPKMEAPDTYTYSDLPWISVRADKPEEVMEHIANYSKYSSSWDWLIPVVAKCYQSIEEMEVEFESEEREIFESIFDVDITLAEIFQSDINAIYERCLDFIKWYNEQN